MSSSIVDTGAVDGVARKWRKIFKMLIMIVFIKTVISFIVNVTIIVIKIILFTLTRPINIPTQDTLW